MNETTELRDRQSQHAERLIRLETLIEQNQENRYEEEQRAFVTVMRKTSGKRKLAGLSPLCVAVVLRRYSLLMRKTDKAGTDLETLIEQNRNYMKEDQPL